MSMQIQMVGLTRGGDHPMYSIYRHPDTDVLWIYRDQEKLFGPFLGCQYGICSEIVNTLAFGSHWDRQNHQMSGRKSEKEAAQER